MSALTPVAVRVIDAELRDQTNSLRSLFNRLERRHPDWGFFDGEEPDTRDGRIFLALGRVHGALLDACETVRAESETEDAD